MTRSARPPVPATQLSEASAPMDTRLASWTLFAMLGFAILAPLLTIGPSNTHTDAAGTGNLARQLGYTLMFMLALVSARVIGHPERLWAPTASVLAMLAWCCLSMTWAVDRGVGARRLILTLIVVFSIFLLVRRAGYERTVAVVRSLLPLILVVNYAAVIAVPGWAIHQTTFEDDPSIIGAWRGILMNKNLAGPVCAYTIIFFMLDARSIKRVIRFAVVVVAALFLYHTQSKSSFGCLAASVGLGVLFTKYDPYYRAIVVTSLIMGACLAGYWVFLNWDFLTAPFYHEDFLTGRVQIWPLLIDYWKDHWLLGSGYGSFWNVHNPQPIYEYARGRGWVTGIASGHNGYLDLLVQTGLPGLLLAVVAIVVAPMRTFLTSVSLDRSRGSLLLACISFAVFHNLTESSIFDTDAAVNVFFMLGIALLSVEARARSLQLSASGLAHKWRLGGQSLPRSRQLSDQGA
jgi:O-antigen ligase